MPDASGNRKEASGEGAARQAGSPPDADWLSPRRARQAIWGFLVLGIGLRLYRYLLDFPLSRDEAKLALSWIDRGFSQLLEPLDYWQVAPTLFLWGNLFVVRWAGYSELSLRLLPLTLGIAALFLMRRLCLRALPEAAALLAFAIFAVSYYPVRFATEAKPYSADLVVSLALTLLAVAAWREPRRYRWLAALALLAPVAVAASYPAAFILGGIGLTLLIRVWIAGDWKARSLWLAFAASALSTFLILYFAVARDQYRQLLEVAANVDFWNSGFPPLAHPLRFPLWLLAAHTGRTFGYPLGAENGGSLLTFACFVAGAVWLYRDGRRWLLALLISPFAVMFVAASLRLYPYGGSGRISQHLAPAICLLAGLGLGWFVSRRRPRNRPRVLAAVLGFLLAWSVGGLIQITLHPYQDEIGSVMSRDFARRFWVDKARNAELVCAVVDAPGGARFRGKLTSLPRYFANQRIYLERRRRGEEPNWSRVSAEHPLRVAVPMVEPPARTQGWIPPSVLDTIARSEGNVASFLATLRSEYRQVGFERVLAERYGPHEVWVELFEFVPEE